MSNEVVKNTKSNILNAKVNNLDKKLSNASTLIHINQCNTGKQNLAKKKKKNGDVDKEILGARGLVNNDAKILEIKGKYINTSDYIKFTSDIHDAKIKQNRISQQILILLIL